MGDGGEFPFGALLRRLRQEAGLTQEELAERAGLSVRGISDLERGVNRTARLDTALLFASGLGLTGEARQHFLAAARGRALSRRRAPSAVPLPPTPLIGRAQELAAVRHLLTQPEVRQITLTGVGGTGKTRLALEVASHVGDVFPDGIHFVDLAPLADASMVAGAIAAVLNVAEQPGQSLRDALLGALANERLLLVLDNFEHLLPAAPLVGDLNARCPGVTVLVTSRAPLRLRAEHVFAVPPLAVPTERQGASWETLARNEAVALFAQRAQAAAGFTLGKDNVAAVVALVRRLDGLPLAIELAAARAPVLSPAAIAARLENRLALLTGGARDLPQRHQTLRQTLDWSYHLLDESEQRLFRRLAVFAGGATLEAVAAVTGEAEQAVLDRVSALVAWGLLRQDERRDDERRDDEPRFRMLETVREYALDRLVASGEAEAAHAAHALSLLRFAERAEPELIGQGQAVWLARFDAERDNLRAALRWLIEHDGVASLCLARALWWFWETRGAFGEGQSWLERALAAGEQGDAGLRARALSGAGSLAYRRRDLDRAEEHLTEALVLHRALGNASNAGWDLAFLGLVALVRGDLAAAEAIHSEALAVAREAGDALVEAGSLANLGEVAHLQGDLARARRLYQESLAAARAMNNQLVAARALTNLAVLAGESDEPRRAAHLHRDALRVYLEVGDRRGTASSLEGLAAAAAAEGRGERAALLYGATVALREAIGSPVPAIEEALHARGVDQARAHLGDDAFGRIWSDGYGAPLEDAIAEGLQPEATPRTLRPPLHVIS